MSWNAGPKTVCLKYGTAHNSQLDQPECECTDALLQVLIACWDDIPEEAELRKLLTGRATRLQSQFRLTYSMILNLLRVEDLKARPCLGFMVQSAKLYPVVFVQTTCRRRFVSCTRAGGL
jgi:hypothetical protein